MCLLLMAAGISVFLLVRVSWGLGFLWGEQRVGSGSALGRTKVESPACCVCCCLRIRFEYLKHLINPKI